MAPIFEGFDHETNWDLSTESEDISHQECGRLNDAFPSIPCGELLCEPYDIGFIIGFVTSLLQLCSEVYRSILDSLGTSGFLWE